MSTRGAVASTQAIAGLLIVGLGFVAVVLVLAVVVGLAALTALGLGTRAVWLFGVERYRLTHGTRTYGGIGRRK